MVGEKQSGVVFSHLILPCQSVRICPTELLSYAKHVTLTNVCFEDMFLPVG